MSFSGKAHISLRMYLGVELKEFYLIHIFQIPGVVNVFNVSCSGECVVTGKILPLILCLILKDSLRQDGIRLYLLIPTNFSHRTISVNPRPGWGERGWCWCRAGSFLSGSAATQFQVESSSCILFSVVQTWQFTGLIWSSVLSLIEQKTWCSQSPKSFPAPVIYAFSHIPLYIYPLCISKSLLDFKIRS